MSSAHRAAAPAPRRAVLLDALGTLVELAPPGPVLAETLAREHGMALTPAEAQRAFAAEIAYYRAHHDDGADAAGLADLRRRCAGVLHAALPPHAAAAIGVRELLPAMLDALRFAAYPDARAALELLRARGVHLVVVSNWDSSLPDVLRAVGLADALDAVLTSAEVGHRKPAPEIFRAALACAGVPPERALHVGDSLAHDVAGAHAAGIAAALLRRGGGEGSEDEGGRGGSEWNKDEGGRGGRGGDEGDADDADVPAGVPVIASLAELPRLLT